VRLRRAGGREQVALIVGPGDRFLSGISYYTALLAGSLAERGSVSVLLLRELCPRMLYPGRSRVGTTDGALPLPEVPVCNGLDWFWGLSGVRALRFFRRAQPRAVILQWWTGTVLHSYLAIAWLATRAGARVIIEFHEIQDVAELRIPLVGRITRFGMRRLLGSADAIVVHSEFDRHELRALYPSLEHMPVEVILHGPYTHHVREMATAEPIDSHPERPTRLLTFGVVRPYKGHAELAGAVRLLRDSGWDIHVTVVGEVWQNYREPLDELAAILPADRLVVVDHYVDDREVPAFFAAADVVVLPYRRSSASGPLHIAMSWGLPVVTTAVGGLVEATSNYTGAVLVAPGDPASLRDGIAEALTLVGRPHTDPHSWGRSSQQYADLLKRLDVDWSHEMLPVRTDGPRVLA
jgi:glycosyltransferase involved in cell wall biosynthesis